MSTDYELLRRFEPVVRYTRGERFFPIGVEPYVGASSLCLQRPGEEPQCLVEEGRLTLDRLASPRTAEPGSVYFLKFIDPLNVAELAAYRVKQTRARMRDGEHFFRAGRGRLARVGYLPRILDMLFSLTLLARGRVPGDTAAAAAMAYARMPAASRRHCYYGRVMRQDGWTVLQYWYFYPFNNWRSGFFGMNDHEADWEMACIYLYESEDGEVRPEWIAYASHDFSGDDLRRRWDDPELRKVGEHPVIYAGAGSHAGYFAPGEYLTELELPLLSPAMRVVDDLQERVRRMLRQYRGEAGQQSNAHRLLRIPFVDYARGDGISIGPGEQREWETHLLDPVPGWVRHYRGLWGLYARDPVSGEDAPAGPMYERDGSVRRSWYDPLGWAGLDKESPPDRVYERTIEQRARAEARCSSLEQEISEKSRELIGLGIELDAMRDRPHLGNLYEEREQKLSETSRELAEARGRLASDRVLIETLRQSEERLRDGERRSPRAHIRHPHTPTSDTELRFDRLAEVWAAVSIALAMVGFVALVLFAREYLIFGLVALISLLIFVESGFRRRLTQLATSVTIGLAVVASLVLLYSFFWEIVVVGALVAAAYMIWENLKELWT